MKYEKTLKITAEDAKRISYWLSEPKDETDHRKNYLSEGAYCKTIEFDNGIEMDIRCCGTKYRNDGLSNAMWCEAVLFKNDCEVGRSGAEDSFVGVWELEYNDDTYIANIVIAS